MRKRAIRLTVVVLSALALCGGGLTRACFATVQDGGMCWVPDVEFPVPCDDDDD